MLKQDLEALIYYDENLSEARLNRNTSKLSLKSEIIDFSITESLWFQIIIKICSFLEEWDNFLGVKNEPEFKHKILYIKRATLPARKVTNLWKDLRKFRNEITAHNFRDKNFKVKIDKMHEYDCPQTIDELIIFINMLKLKTDILLNEFPEYKQMVISDAKKYLKVNVSRPSKNLDIRKTFEEVSGKINKNLQ